MPKIIKSKPRISTVPAQSRLSIYTTRPSISRRPLKTPPSIASTSASTSVVDAKKETFAKPLARPMVGTSIKVAASKLPVVSSNSFKCKYCDRTFVKSVGLEHHLMENCEKIPASQRRLLLKNDADPTKDKNRKPYSHKIVLNARKIEQTWEHSRFFLEKINQAKSITTDDNDATSNIESGLSNLRNEMKLLSNAHTGVKRTPKKLLKCHMCEKKFLDCVQYAIHISNHSTQIQT